MKERVSLAYISNRSSRSRTVLSVLALILLSGCFGRSPDVRHFVLGASDSPVTKERSPETAVVVGPVRLPAYLERPQMAKLKGGGEVALDDFARWLGGFEENFLRAISLGLARELGSDRVVEDPSKAPFSIDYQVRLHVDDMILDSAGALRVRIRWALVSRSQDIFPRFFVMDERFPSKGATAFDLVQAHDRALGELVDRISNEIEKAESAR